MDLSNFIESTRQRTTTIPLLLSCRWPDRKSQGLTHNEQIVSSYCVSIIKWHNFELHLAAFIDILTNYGHPDCCTWHTIQVSTQNEHHSKELSVDLSIYPFEDIRSGFDIHLNSKSIQRRGWKWITDGFILLLAASEYPCKCSPNLNNNQHRNEWKECICRWIDSRLATENASEKSIVSE